jgi:2'-5' RNA ligase
VPDRDLSANDFPHVYASLGIDVNKLGCIMADTEPIPISELVTKPEPDLYHAANKDHFWVRGAVGETGAHVTLLYGLLQHGTKIRSEVNEVLSGWSLDDVTIEKLGVFNSPYVDEPYKCIVAHLKLTPELLEGHARLELLPHINTFLKYRPHVTLAYVKEGTEKRWLRELGNGLIGKKLAITQLNYGTEHK